jgi:hypothetical protein
MAGIFLTCCTGALKNTRHFTPEVGMVISLMLLAAVLVAAVVIAFSPLLLRTRA